MSGIGGVFDFCNAPVIRGLIEPLRTRSGHLLAWNGRLDNRHDLLSHFCDGLNGDTSDVALVMTAYLEWGDDFLARIVGDFVLSLYDPRSHTLFLARDPFGTRTLYYSLKEQGVVWSSTLESLIVATGIDPEVDDDYVAGYLALLPEMSLSPYKQISAVVPGHVVEIRKGHTLSRRFWKLDPEHEIKYQNDADYEEHFRQLFHEAVKCRLRSDGPVWAELSGGLDSSSIVCVADQILEAGEAATPRLETVSYVDEHSTTFFDRQFIRVIEDFRGRQGHHLQSEKHWVSFVSPEARFISKPHTGVCVEGTDKWLSREMQADSATVLLSGLGGDQLLWSIREATPALTDLIYERKPLALHQQIQVWSGILKQPYLRTLWQDAVVPLLPATLTGIFQRQLTPAPWLNREFVKTGHIKERLVVPSDPFHYRLPSSRRQASMVQFIIASIAVGECWEHARFNKTYPFLHRPLVEFLMSIPFEQKLRRDETRSLMRRALKNIVPPKVLNRQNKGIVGETFCRGLADQWPVLEPMLAGARVCQRGYVDEKLFRSALDLARHGRKIETSTLLKTIAIEIWLRSLEYRHVRSREAVWSKAEMAFQSDDSRAAAVAACS